jgi:putative flavoprotein involved in K+ transport
MSMQRSSASFDVIVIGGGQSGLATGYYLAQQGLRFVILDARARVGDVWRDRWDSLRLFTPARYDSLDGLPFPGDAGAFPTKDEMADYLEAYAKRYQLPVRTGVSVSRLWRDGRRYVVEAGDERFEADHVVVAMSSYQRKRVPAFAKDLDPSIVQIHSLDYRRASQLRTGAVLIAGAGNSGAEIAKELGPTHQTWLSGRDVGHLPFHIGSRIGRVMAFIILRVLFFRVLTTSTPMGRKARPSFVRQGGTLIRVKPKELAAARVERAPRVAGVQRGKPLLQDGRVLDVANVIWCTGFDPRSSFVDLPVYDEQGEPKQTRGVADGEPGLYFVGLHFLYAVSSTMVQGVSRDAAFVVKTIAERLRAEQPATISRTIASSESQRQSA